jgi:GTPase SAR1 family protein
MSDALSVAIDYLRSHCKDNPSRTLNESDTRHKIIDVVLHDFLSWPKNRVSTEEYICPGFLDYALKKPNGDFRLLIEAKREGSFFELPLPHSSTETCCHIAISRLTTNPEIRAALNQVRAYCIDNGCEFACITNGHEWIFFKTFEKGKKFENLQAFVVRSLRFFTEESTKARNLFSFWSIEERQSLPSILTSAAPKDRTLFFPKEKISSYAHQITANKLASKLRSPVNQYFGVIRDNDTEFMDRCYVSQQEYQGASDGIRNLIQDSLSPYLEDHGISQLDNTGKGGQLGGRITKNLKRGRGGEVLILFGGKGAGKSTFIKRLLHHKPPRWLSEHSVIAIVDLLKVPEEKAAIREHIWSSLVRALDTSKKLDESRGELTSGLFADRFEIASVQDLAGLSPYSEAYNLKLNALIAAWKADQPYCASRLVNYWSSQGKGTIVVVDNTDQFTAEHQDFCFSSAQEISNLLQCTVLISMREERFYNSKIHGLLDAFQNSGFHISSPRPSEVFKKRLEYVCSMLNNSVRRNRTFGDVDSEFIRDARTYLSILGREFSDDHSPLNRFLSACAHGDIRLSLDIFRSFLLSGYTNVEEMVNSGLWKFQVHQVIKPVMIPTRYFYDETLSDIPNVFQVRTTRNASHFTALRILRRLSKGIDVSAPTYFAVAELRAYFAETFNMVDDFESNLDILLKHGFVESNNRLDAFSQDVDSIKITSYGQYMINDLAYYFTYLDLVCTDCGIFDEQVSNYLSVAATDEYRLFTQGERLERIQRRLERVNRFIAYLEYEERQERDLYSLEIRDDNLFTHKMRQTFSQDEPRIYESAKRQPNSSGPRRRPTTGRATGRR